MRLSFKTKQTLVDKNHSMNHTAFKEPATSFCRWKRAANPGGKSLMRTEKLDRLRAGLYIKTENVSNQLARPLHHPLPACKTGSNAVERTP